MSYKDNQKKIQKSFFANKKKEMGGVYRRKKYDYILKDYNDNLVCKDVIDYFAKNSINWWGGKQPTGNTLSSQIACINHLFPIRQDHDAVLAIAQSVDSDFDDVEKLQNDNYENGYISFEAVSAIDHLNEARGINKKLHRGSQCTSIDAIIIAKKQGKRVLLVIEWKYVEKYGNEDKSQKQEGKTRLKRYSNLMKESKELEIEGDCTGSVFFFEPFYQLMRQVLWAEQMININHKEEPLHADDFIHVHVVPKGNKELLQKKYRRSHQDMLTTWRCRLKNPNKYVLISPAEFFSKLSCDKWKNLICYLKARYWQ